MASTESSTSLHTTATPEEPIVRKVIEEVKAMEQETGALSKEVVEKENPKTEELPSEANQIPKSEEEAEVKRTEPPAVEVKIEHDSIVDIPGKDPITHSQEQTDPELAAEAVNGEIVEQPTTESVAEEVLEKPGEISVEERQEQQPKMIDASEPSSVEVVEKPKEFSDILPVKESEEVILKDLEDSEAVSKEVEKQESQVLEIDVKQKEESKFAEQVGKSESVEEVGEIQEPQEVQHVKESEAVVKDVEVPVAASKDIDESKSVVPKVEEKPEEQSEVTEAEVLAPEVEAKQKGQSEVAEQIEPKSVVPEVEAKPKEQSEVIEQVEPQSVVPEVEAKPKEQSEVTEQVEPPIIPEVEDKPKEQSEVTEQVEKAEQVEANEKQQEYSEVYPVKESDAAGVKDMEVLEDVVKPKAAAKQEEQSVVAEEADKTKLLDPEVQEKPEEQTEVVVEKVENPKLLDLEVQGKPEEKSEAAEEVVELKPEAVELHIEVKPVGKTEVRETLPVTDKLEETTSVKGEKTSKEEEPGAASLPGVTEKVAGENGKKEADGTAVGEVLLSKEAEVEIEKGGEEKEEITIKSEGKTVDRDVLNEELVQPSKVDYVKNAVSSAEVIERSFDKEITDKGVEPIVENKIVKKIKEDMPALVETSKDASAEDVKLDETPTTVDEPVQESQGSGSAVKEEQNTKIGEDKLEKENVEEMSKSNVQDLEPSGDDVNTSRDLPTEVPAKSAHKQSNNILTKVKQSLVKAKKAIIGKSPSSKNLTSDTKGDIKVK